MKTIKKPTASFLGAVIFGFALYFAMTALQPHLGQVIFDYNTWYGNIGDSALWRFLWMVGDGSEPFFHKTIFGGLFLFIGSLAAYILDRRQSKLRGTPISYGMGRLWPWIFAAALVSHGITVILFGGLVIENDAWAATFVPYVSVASGVILLYGGSVASMLTGALLGAVFTTPITIFLRSQILIPLGLPGVIGSVSGMWIGGIFTFEICRILPWMKKRPLAENQISPAKVPGEAMSISEYKLAHPNMFFIRRMLADYSEPVFVGNEIAGAGLIIGSLLTWALNPMQPFYGTGWFPACLLSQILTGAVAMYVYWDQWMASDFFPTFVPIVSVAPAMVLTFGPSMPVIIISAVLGGLSCPACAKMINDKLPAHWNSVVGNTASMAICSFGVYAFLYYLIMAFPALGA